MHLPIFFFRLLLVVVPALLLPALSSCGSDHDDDRDEENRRTLFVYMPWSTDLLSCFETNLSDFEAAIEQQKGLKSQRVIVYLASSKTRASMFEITCDGGQCTRRQLKEYSGTGYTTLQGLTAILADVKTYAPATLSYSMIIGCHGLGWVPVKALAQSRAARGRTALHWNRGNQSTRLFGGRTSDCQTDIETLRESMEAADFHTEYILFDDCYMSGIEVAYELRHVTRRLIASTSEMMMYGIPYKLVGGNLLGTPDYSALCRNFLAFYSSYSTPSGTLTVTDCSKLDSLALAVARLNLRSDHAPVCPDSLQRLGGYTPGIFFDMQSYLRHLCPNPQLRAEADSLLHAAVEHTVHTPTIFTTQISSIAIREFSGLTISEPSLHPFASQYYSETSWFKDTH